VTGGIFTASMDLLLEMAAQSAMKHGRVTAAAIGIRDDRGRQHVRCWGALDLAPSPRTCRSTQFAIGSVSKQFTAAAISKLAEEGRLSLQDEVRGHLRLDAEGLRGVRIEHLLRHTAGLGSLADDHMLESLSQSGDYTQEGILRYVIKATATCPPGASWFYSNTGYYLLGLVVEAVSGVSLAEYLEAAVLHPVGLLQTTTLPSPRNHAKGYVRGGSFLRAMDPPNPQLTFGSGGLWSTADDLLSWQTVLYGGGVVNRTSLARMMCKTQLPTGEVPYGTGLYILTRDGHREISHHGSVGAYSSQLSYYPDLDVGVVVLTSGYTEEAESLNEVIRGMILGQSPAPGMRASPVFSKRTYVGRYTYGNKQLLVAHRGDGLVMETPSGELAELRTCGDGLFEFANRRGLQVQFTVERDVALSYVVARYGRPLAIGRRL
jgi:D-alanyl-D-alanine carboxypeptidase